MGMQVGGRNGGPMADINVTPLVDVVLVLLIMFMVVMPMMVSGVDVRLPTAVQAERVKDEGQHVIVSIDENGLLFVGRDPVEPDDLAVRMRDIMVEEEGGVENTPILIKGDQNLTWGDVHPVLDQIKDELVRTDLILSTIPIGAN